MRIIAGKWRRRRLTVHSRTDLRPTPDRVRETLFAWLTPAIEGSRCLDLFAGSGALGFEAASRGAAHVTMVERDPALVAVLEKQRELLSAAEVEVVQADAFHWLEATDAAFDIVFIDPPFGKFDLGAICAAVERRGVAATSGFVYLEYSTKAQPPILPESWQRYRNQRAGEVRYDLMVMGSHGRTV